jgi:hypothetical protein
MWRIASIDAHRTMEAAQARSVSESAWVAASVEATAKAAQTTSAYDCTPLHHGERLSD